MSDEVEVALTIEAARALGAPLTEAIADDDADWKLLSPHDVAAHVDTTGAPPCDNCGVTP